MYASKEEATKALFNLRVVSDRIGQPLRDSLSGYLIALQEFLEAAGRKLPSEAAYAKDKKRKEKP